MNTDQQTCKHVNLCLGIIAVMLFAWAGSAWAIATNATGNVSIVFAWLVPTVALTAFVLKMRTPRRSACVANRLDTLSSRLPHDSSFD